MSKAGQYLDCPEAYRLRFVVNAPEIVSGAAVAGIAIHQTVQRGEASLVPGGELEILNNPDFETHLTDVFLEEFWSRLAEAGGPEGLQWGGRASQRWPDGENHKWWDANGPGLITNYLELRRRDLETGHSRVQGTVELDIAFQLPNGRTISGRIDQLVQVDPNGQSIIRDLKSGSYPEPPTKLVWYAFGIEKAGHPRPSIAEIVYLRTGKVERFQVDDYLQVSMDMIEQAEKGIAAEIYPHRIGPLCGYCSVRSSCEWGKTL